MKALGWTCSAHATLPDWSTIIFTRMYEPVRGTGYASNPLYSHGNVSIYSSSIPCFHEHANGCLLLHLPGMQRVSDSTEVHVPNKFVAEVTCALTAYNATLPEVPEVPDAYDAGYKLPKYCMGVDPAAGADQAVFKRIYMSDGFMGEAKDEFYTGKLGEPHTKPNVSLTYTPPFRWDGDTRERLITFSDVRDDIRGKGLLFTAANGWRVISADWPGNMSSIQAVYVPGKFNSQDTLGVRMDDDESYEQVRLALNAYLVTEWTKYADTQRTRPALRPANNIDLQFTVDKHNTEEKPMLAFNKADLIKALTGARQTLAHAVNESNNNLADKIRAAAEQWLPTKDTATYVEVYEAKAAENVLAEYDRVIAGLTLSSSDPVTDVEVDSSLSCSTLHMLNVDNLLKNTTKHNIKISR